MIFDGIQKYIANSKQTTGRSFHITMTYFWIQMVHFGIKSVLPTLVDTVSELSEDKTLNDASIKSETEVDDGDVQASNEEFCRFLILNPFVVDGNLWADYYSKDVMMSSAAKESMVFPDKKSLPNLVVRDAVKQKSN